MKLMLLIPGLFILIHMCQLTNSFELHLVDNNLDDFNLTTVEIIEKYGYTAETHTTVTEDGYIIVLHRIPHGKNSIEPGFPILLGHSLLFDSAGFLLYGEKSLGFFLADQGYDVWLINFRGTHYTRTHTYLSPEDSKFWDFSLSITLLFHEFGVYDIPASINYICNYTNNEDVLYLGYSMGTTSFFVFGSERPEYQKNVRGAVLLGPVAILKYSNSMPRFAYIPLIKLIQLFSKPHSLFDNFQDTALLQQLVKFGCNSTEALRDICTVFSFLLVGYDTEEFDERTVLNVASHLSSISTKVLGHYAQLFISSEFQQYDYGKPKNLVMYKSTSPPIYDLESITIPISLLIGLNDVFATPENTLELTKRLRSVKSVYVAPQRTFNHLDYLQGKHIEETVYPEIAKRLKDFLNGDGVDPEQNSSAGIK